MTDRGDGVAGSKTIMVVEPDVSARTVLSDYLRDCGYVVVSGTSAEDVLRMVRSPQPPQIILTDIQLAGDVDGYRLSQELKRTNPEIHVVLTYGPNGAANKAAEICDEGPLAKPYHPEEVVRRIRQLRETRVQQSR